jgi:hypothetical protein
MNRAELSDLLIFFCAAFLFAFVVSLAVDIQELRRKKMEEGDGLVCPDCPPEEGTE